MNGTHRGLNRTLLIIVGLVWLSLGAAVIAAYVSEPMTSWWNAGVSRTLEWIEQAHSRTVISEATTVSWFVLAVLAAGLIVVVLAVLVMTRWGGGRLRVLVRSDAEQGIRGGITLRDDFASDALTQSLQAYDEILASQVKIATLGRDEVMQVAVTPRQSVSPVDITAIVSRLVENLAVLSGKKIPVYLSMKSGVRTKLAAEKSRVA